MNEFKDIVKKGWHPEKEGTTLRGQVSSLVRGKDNTPSTRQQHASRPLSDLADPSSFAPPPRRAVHAPASPPVRGPPPPRRVQPAPSTYHDPRAARNQAYTNEAARQQGNAPEGGEDAPPPPPYVASPTSPPNLPPRRASVPAGEKKDAGQGGGGGYLDGCLNPGASSRLGAAGVSVPGLGIGSGSGSGSRLHTTTTTPAQTEGTTWAQKQSALKTAASFHKDPSSVSMTDARSAASTANNFRQRHGEQVKSGWERVNGLNQKYGVSDKVGAFVNKHQPAAGESSAAAAAGKKAPPPPPPPPKKKPSLGGFGASSSGGDRDGPPAIPSATRPSF